MTPSVFSTSLTVAILLGLAGDAPAQNTTEPTKPQPTEKAAEPVKKPEATRTKVATKPSYEKATFGAGCFWHVEAVFERLPGVESAVSGYSGGDPRYASYEIVHQGWTGHAEVVQVTYNPEIISYEDLLKVFWSNHDPTTLNRQGEDEGTQYRSVIFYHTREQRDAALQSYQHLTAAGTFRGPIVTQLMPMRGFFPAEPEHQDFYGGKPRASARRSKTALKKAMKSQPKAKSPSPAPKPAGTASTPPSAKSSN